MAEAKTAVAEETKEVKEYKVKKDHIAKIGRRKTATARVFMYQGKGEIVVNHKDINEYFPTEREKLAWMNPFHVVGVSHPESKFNATIKVEGSGRTGQLGAVVLGISRVLASLSEENKVALRKAGLLTRDPRMVERKKYFFVKARKKPQYSKR